MSAQRPKQSKAAQAEAIEAERAREHLKLCENQYQKVQNAYGIGHHHGVMGISEMLLKSHRDFLKPLRVPQLWRYRSLSFDTNRTAEGDIRSRACLQQSLVEFRQQHQSGLFEIEPFRGEAEKFYDSLYMGLTTLENKIQSQQSIPQQNNSSHGQLREPNTAIQPANRFQAYVSGPFPPGQASIDHQQGQRDSIPQQQGSSTQRNLDVSSVQLNQATESQNHPQSTPEIASSQLDCGSPQIQLQLLNLPVPQQGDSPSQPRTHSTMQQSFTGFGQASTHTPIKDHQQVPETANLRTQQETKNNDPRKDARVPVSLSGKDSQIVGKTKDSASTEVRVPEQARKSDSKKVQPRIREQCGKRNPKESQHRATIQKQPTNLEPYEAQVRMQKRKESPSDLRNAQKLARTVHEAQSRELRQVRSSSTESDQTLPTNVEDTQRAHTIAQPYAPSTPHIRNPDTSQPQVRAQVDTSTETVEWFLRKNGYSLENLKIYSASPPQTFRQKRKAARKTDLKFVDQYLQSRRDAIANQDERLTAAQKELVDSQVKLYKLVTDYPNIDEATRLSSWLLEQPGMKPMELAHVWALRAEIFDEFVRPYQQVTEFILKSIRCIERFIGNTQSESERNEAEDVRDHRIMMLVELHEDQQWKKASGS